MQKCKQALRMTEDKDNNTIEVDLQDNKDLVLRYPNSTDKQYCVSCVDALC